MTITKSSGVHASYPSLRGRTVFVTGGGTGIGAAIVEAFCVQGSKVVFVDIKEAESRALCERLNAVSETPPLFLYCDLRDIGALRKAIEKAKQTFGNISVLINNAADDTRHKFSEVTPEYWDERLAINMRPAFFAAQAVYPQMKETGGGSIINFGSISWMICTGGMPAYTASKAAMHGLSRGLARDFGPARIRINTLVPGWVMTQRQLDKWVDEEAKQLIDRSQCLPGRVMPDDIANMALFLAADDSAMITAQSFVVDGGWV